MALVEPIPGEPAAIADLPDDRLLIVADYHAGFEAAMRQERGIELPSQAPDRKERLTGLVADVAPDRLVVLGDLVHSIGGPGGAERAELEVLFEAIDVPVMLAKGNHDGVIEEFLAADPVTFGNVEVTDARGTAVGRIGLTHGHTWPSPAVLDTDVICIGHEHPCVRMTDEVGGSRVERAWLRGSLTLDPFEGHVDDLPEVAPELVVFPAFNPLCGGTWINVPTQSFLAPFLPAALPDGQAYLLDGTKLGRYDRI